MNNLKFRAWHKELKEMEKVLLMCFVNEYVDVLPFRNLEGGSQEAWSFKDIILMQSTGLKDCKGVEVFHGDIVKLKHMILRVTWDEDFAQPCLENGVEAEHLGDMIAGAQIVGNIYENSELLRGGV